MNKCLEYKIKGKNGFEIDRKQYDISQQQKMKVNKK